jgi:hypothetical protein
MKEKRGDLNQKVGDGSKGHADTSMLDRFRNGHASVCQVVQKAVLGLYFGLALVVGTTAFDIHTSRVHGYCKGYGQKHNGRSSQGPHSDGKCFLGSFNGSKTTKEDNG